MNDYDYAFKDGFRAAEEAGEKYIDKLEKMYADDTAALMKRIEELEKENKELKAELADKKTTKPLRMMRHV